MFYVYCLLIYNALFYSYFFNCLLALFLNEESLNIRFLELVSFLTALVSLLLCCQHCLGFHSRKYLIFKNIFLVLVDEFKITYYYFTLAMNMICLMTGRLELHGSWLRSKRNTPPPPFSNKFLLVGHL